jgi:hypothetical protein
LASALLIGCGNPSKDDVCGGCAAGSTEKALCETTYDACDDDGDCIEALEDTKICD